MISPELSGCFFILGVQAQVLELGFWKLDRLSQVAIGDMTIASLLTVLNTSLVTFGALARVAIVLMASHRMSR